MQIKEAEEHYRAERSPLEKNMEEKKKAEKRKEAAQRERQRVLCLFEKTIEDLVKLPKGCVHMAA